MTPEEFIHQTHVSRETCERLEAYSKLLLRWNARINLIARSTEAHIWSRHMADSAQLWRLRSKSAKVWADLGAGAGFPGLVVAALAKDEAPGLDVILMESDARKCAFLAEAARVMEIHPIIQHGRIESQPSVHADIVSARALAPLEILLRYVSIHRSGDGIALFPKGETVHKEIEAAARTWRFEHRIHPSAADSRGVIVEVGAVSSV